MIANKNIEIISSIHFDICQKFGSNLIIVVINHYGGSPSKTKFWE